MDYTSGPYTVTFSVRQTTATFDIPINNDNILEGDENFMLTINSSSLRDGITLGNFSEATVTIIDNDRKYYNSNALYASTKHDLTSKVKVSISTIIDHCVTIIGKLILHEY